MFKVLRQYKFQNFRIVILYYSQEKKPVFLRFLKVAGKLFITTVSKKNVQKKVTTTMVDFNNKFLNDSLMDTSIRVVEMTVRIYA